MRYRKTLREIIEPDAGRIGELLLLIMPVIRYSKNLREIIEPDAEGIGELPFADNASNTI